MFNEMKKIFCKHKYEKVDTLVEKNKYSKIVYEIIKCKKCGKTKIVDNEIWNFFNNKNIF